MAGEKDSGKDGGAPRSEARDETGGGQPRDETGGGQPRDETGGGQPRDETGDWRKGGNSDGKETGGPVGIKFGIEPPGVVRVIFDRPVETLVLRPLEALMFSRELIQNTIMCANVKPVQKDKSRIILPS